MECTWDPAKISADVSCSTKNLTCGEIDLLKELNTGASLWPEFVLVYVPKVTDKLIRNHFQFPELLQQAASSRGFPYFAGPLSIA